MSELQDLCSEILKDENGNEITPSCGIEKLLCCLTDKIEELETTDNNTTYTLSQSGTTITLTGSDGSKSEITISASTSDDIDGGYPDN